VGLILILNSVDEMIRNCECVVRVSQVKREICWAEIDREKSIEQTKRQADKLFGAEKASSLFEASHLYR
jgi:hypothetical protein